jgi:cell division protein FtsB
MRVASDMHVPPAARRWARRVGLALVIAIALGYLPGEVLRRDPRVAVLRGQLDALHAQERDLTAQNAVLASDVEALRTDVGAVENRARADLGMVYPDEIVLRVRREPGQ